MERRDWGSESQRNVHAFTKLNPFAYRRDHRRNKDKMIRVFVKIHQRRSTPRIKDEKKAKASIENLSSSAGKHVNIPLCITTRSRTYFQAKIVIPTSTSTKSSKGNVQTD